MDGTHIQLLESFACLGADCSDTCCKGWDMQLDEAHYQRFLSEAPELMDAVDEGPSGHIMKRDPETDYCVKFTNGLCGIHAAKGNDFLGDACHFFPRSMRALGEAAVMSASFSCPEVVRLAMELDAPYAYLPKSFDRVPESLKDYAPKGVNADASQATVQEFINYAMDTSRMPEASLMAMASVAKSMGNLDVASWPEAVPFYLRTAESRLVQAEADPSDAYRALHGLCVLMHMIPGSKKPRLMETVERMLSALGAEMDWETLMIRSREGEGVHVYDALKMRCNERVAEWLAPSLRRWLAGQLSLHLFPFGGLGDSSYDKLRVIAFRYALTRLALMALLVEYGDEPPMEVRIRAMQSLARLLDHMGDASLILTLCDEAGWDKESRLSGLIAG